MAFGGPWEGSPGGLLTDEDKKQAMWQGLLGTGLGILANNTGHYGAAGPAIGAGGLQGMRQYQTHLGQAQNFRQQAKTLDIAEAYRKSQEALNAERTSELKRNRDLEDQLGALPQTGSAEERLAAAMPILSRINPAAAFQLQSGMADRAAGREVATSNAAAGREAQSQRDREKAQDKLDQIRMIAQLRPPPQPPQPQAPVAVLGPDGKPVFVPPSQAYGKRPALKPDERKLQTEEAAATRRAEGAVNRADVVIQKIDEVLPKVSPFTTGTVGTLLGKIPGTGAYDLEKGIDTVKANIGFQELQAMREASPTGGALGQVAVQELNMLQAVLSNLDKGQSKDVLKSNLEQVRKHFDNWRSVMKQSAGQAGSTQVGPGTATPAGLSQDEQKELDALRSRFKK